MSQGDDSGSKSGELLPEALGVALNGFGPDKGLPILDAEKRRLDRLPPGQGFPLHVVFAGVVLELEPLIRAVSPNVRQSPEEDVHVVHAELA